jgi:fumitremorgin C monooxygenase
MRYASDRTRAMGYLHCWSPRLQPLVHWFLPSCRQLRATVHRARLLVERVVAARRKNGECATASAPASIDALSWIERAAHNRGIASSYDVTLTQLRLAYAAVYTN